MSLFPTGYTDADAIAEAAFAPASAGYRISAAFDPAEGDFARDGGNRIRTANGHDAWRMWCLKTVATPRYSCSAYCANYGPDITSALRAATRGEAESILTREIAGALLADPYRRTRAVESIRYDWADDTGVLITVSVSGAEGQSFDFSVRFTANRYRT